MRSVYIYRMKEKTVYQFCVAFLVLLIELKHRKQLSQRTKLGYSIFLKYI